MPPKNAVQRLHDEFQGITASRAATIAGVNPYSSPYELFMQMTGQLPPQEQNFPMWLGTQMEGIVIRAFTRETKLKCKRPHGVVDRNFWFTTEEYGFPMGALIDATCMDPELTGVEAKTASAWLSADWEDDVPVQYMCQIQHQLACTGWDHFYAAAIVGNKFVYHRVPRDEELIALITDKERDFFWDHLVEGVPPDADGSEATSNAIKARWGKSEPGYTEVIDDPEIERLAMSYQAQGKAIKKMETEREEVGNRLKVLIEDREALISRTKKVNWKTQEYDYFDLKAFRAAGWDKLAAMYTVKKTKRPLTITEVK